MKNLSFNLTKNQEEVINEINADLKSNKKMFRVLQGDVGSGKTIVAFMTVANVLGWFSISSNGPNSNISKTTL